MTAQIPHQDIRAEIDSVYRAESRRVLATLIRLLGDFDRAEEALSDALVAAMEQWPRDGVPENPRAWLVSAGRFKGIDAIRRRTRFDTSVRHLVAQVEEDAEASLDLDAPSQLREMEDDQLRLIFTCCHPALAEDARVALTLREVCGLTTEQIAHAFLAAVPTMAQRIVRAKAKIRDAGIPYQVPEPHQLPERLEAVLRVVYLVFNEGYFASSGDALTRADLSGEAIRLGRLLAGLLPDGETLGLLSLMLLTEARRPARVSADGHPVLLEDQDRNQWNQEQIAEGLRLLEQAFGTGHVGPYAVQAAIAAEHDRASNAADTDWNRIVGLYDVLLDAAASPVVELNRAAAVAMRDGPEQGLRLIDGILARGDLERYHLAHAARADLCRRLGRIDEARAAYRQALELTAQGPEREFLAERLSALDAAAAEADGAVEKTPR